MQNPDWQGEGILVEKRGLRARVIIPELAFETYVHIKEDLPLNTRLLLKFKAENLPILEANFQLLDWNFLPRPI
jgi:exoribonuclease-2